MQRGGDDEYAGGVGAGGSILALLSIHMGPQVRPLSDTGSLSALPRIQPVTVHLHLMAPQLLGRCFKEEDFKNNEPCSCVLSSIPTKVPKFREYILCLTNFLIVCWF